MNPILVYQHTIHKEQTTFVGNDISRIEDLFAMAARLRDLVSLESNTDPDCAQAILNHHIFMYVANLKRYSWHISFRERCRLLKKYRPYTPSKNRLLNYCEKHPISLSALISLIYPILTIARYCYLKIKELRQFAIRRKLLIRP